MREKFGWGGNSTGMVSISRTSLPSYHFVMISGIASFSFIYSDVWMWALWILLCSCGIWARLPSFYAWFLVWFLTCFLSSIFGIHALILLQNLIGIHCQLIPTPKLIDSSMKCSLCEFVSIHTLCALFWAIFPCSWVLLLLRISSLRFVQWPLNSQQCWWDHHGIGWQFDDNEWRLTRDAFWARLISNKF